LKMADPRKSVGEEDNRRVSVGGGDDDLENPAEFKPVPFNKALVGGPIAACECVGEECPEKDFSTSFNDRQVIIQELNDELLKLEWYANCYKCLAPCCAVTAVLDWYWWYILHYPMWVPALVAGPMFIHSTVFGFLAYYFKEINQVGKDA